MKKAFILPVIVVVAVGGIVLLRSRTPGDSSSRDESASASGPSTRPLPTAKPPRPSRADPDDPSSPGGTPHPVPLPPATLPTAESPSTAKAFRRAAEDYVARLRPILDDLLSKSPFTGSKEELDAIRLKLKAALLEIGDPAVIASLVIWSEGAVNKIDALSQVRSLAVDLIRQDKGLSEWLRSKSVAHFLAETAGDGAQALSGRLFSIDFLLLQTEDLAGLSPAKVSPLMYCLSSADLHLLRTGMTQSLLKEEAIVYQPLLKVLSSYLSVSPEARDAITDLLRPPPQNPSLRLSLMNAIGTQQSRVLEDPDAFRFLMSSLKDTGDPRLSTAAALAFIRSPSLVGGSTPQSGEALATLVEQYRWAKGVASEDRALKTQEQTFLISIASTDVAGTPAFVRDALLDSTVSDAAKLTMLKRIQNIASGAIDVDHGYRKTAPALTEAIQSVSSQLSTTPLFKNAFQACLDSLAASQKR
jgi:hypothetical protein